jgi:hypothetical protein
MAKIGPRVIARLDEEEQAILRRARAITGNNSSEVIRVALRCYARTLATETPLEIFERHGVVGAGTGPTDLSETYKDQINYAHKSRARKRK